MKKIKENEKCVVRIGTNADGYIARIALMDRDDIVELYDTPYDAVRGITVMMRNRMGFSTDKIPSAISDMLHPVSPDLVEAVLDDWKEHLKRLEFAEKIPNNTKDIADYQRRKGCVL